jgi:hypothetical protein
LGCAKGNDCRYFHPKLCRSSVLKRECFNSDCTFVHLKHTRRFQKVPNGSNSSAEQKPPAPLSHKPGQRIRFNSSSTQGGSPYAPTIQKPQRKNNINPTAPCSSGEKDQSNSFLLNLIENLKEGIILQMSEKLLEFRASLPELVREQLTMNRPPVPSLQTSQLPSHQQMSFFPTAPRQPHAGFPTLYPGCSF